MSFCIGGTSGPRQPLVCTPMLSTSVTLQMSAEQEVRPHNSEQRLREEFLPSYTCYYQKIVRWHNIRSQLSLNSLNHLSLNKAAGMWHISVAEWTKWKSYNMYNKTYRGKYTLDSILEKERMKDAKQRTISECGLLFCFTCLDF